MFFKRYLIPSMFATIVLNLVGCQEAKQPEPKVLDEKEYALDIKPSKPTVVPNQYSEPKLEQDQFIKLEPVRDSEFEAIMKASEDRMKSSNAMLNTLDSSVEMKISDSIDNNEYSATNTITTSSNTELDAVNQAIQAALPALEE